VVTSLAGSDDDEWAAAAAAALPAALAWLRVEVAAAYAGQPDGSEPPRAALHTLLVVLEELQHLLPLAIASLVDDAMAGEDSGIAPGERHRPAGSCSRAGC
jgi:hypothetical protein